MRLLVPPKYVSRKSQSSGSALPPLASYSFLAKRQSNPVAHRRCYRAKLVRCAGVSSDICVRFGKRIRALRKQRNWTQVYMAEHVGMDRSFISDLENGKREICIRNLELLATTFNMTVSKLLSRL